MRCAKMNSVFLLCMWIVGNSALMTIPKLYSIGKFSRIVSKESLLKSVSSLQTFSVIPNAALFSPLERIVITANGNLQRILSAFHNMPISVAVLKSEYRGENFFDREVYLHLQDSSSTENQHILCYIKGEVLQLLGCL